MKESHGKIEHIPVVPDGKCPDDPQVVCREFMTKSVVEWQIWIAQASGRFYTCCGKQGPDWPSLLNVDCSEVDDCRDVCKAFDDWAKEAAKWARDFTKDVEKCIAGWHSKVDVPKVPGGRCKECSEACAAIREFHAELALWAEDVRAALNDKCPGPPGKVPPPPPPPFG